MTKSKRDSELSFLHLELSSVLDRAGKTKLELFRDIQEFNWEGDSRLLRIIHAFAGILEVEMRLGDIRRYVSELRKK